MNKSVTITKHYLTTTKLTKYNYNHFLLTNVSKNFSFKLKNVRWLIALSYRDYQWIKTIFIYLDYSWVKAFTWTNDFEIIQTEKIIFLYDFVKIYHKLATRIVWRRIISVYFKINHFKRIRYFFPIRNISFSQIRLTRYNQIIWNVVKFWILSYRSY